MRKNKIIVLIMTIIMIFAIASNTVVLADATSALDPQNTQVAPFEKAINIILGMFQVGTVGVGVIMLIVLAIKYMMAAPNDKAEIKKHATVYIVGAIMAFGATGIVTLIKSFTESALQK